MNKLPDLLAPNLRVVFCGTASGRKSAETQSYYAHPSNRFWRILATTNLTPRQLAPHEFHDLLNYGIGLTDLAKTQAGLDSEVIHRPDDAAALRAKIEQFQPQVLAFTSKEAAKRYFGRKQIAFGRQPDSICTTAIFVLPSTSGLASASWDETHWQALADDVKAGTTNL